MALFICKALYMLNNIFIRIYVKHCLYMIIYSFRLPMSFLKLKTSDLIFESIQNLMSDLTFE